MIDTRNVQNEEQTSFEDALQKIREIVSALESGHLTLEESIANYRAGAHLIDQCRSLIADAELRVTDLARKDEADQ